MKKKGLIESIKRHIAGATVVHTSPFANLEHYENEIEIDQPFVDRWVKPYYFNLRKKNQEWIDQIISIYPEITDDIILQNLGTINWRTRSTGAFFAAIKNKEAFTDIIGTHLLKSEVCYAGGTYAKVLAFFNTEKAIDYLVRYLDYYLKQKDLYYDQSDVLIAGKYLDQINDTNVFERFTDDWNTFSEGKDHLQEIFDDDSRLGLFIAEIDVIKKIRESVN